MAYLFLFLCVLFSSGQLMTNKLYQMRQRLTIPSYMLYLIVISVVSTPLYFLMSRCDTTVDLKLFVYSFVYAAVVVIHALLSLLGMSYVNIAVVTIVLNAGSLFIPAIYGFLFLHEPMTFSSILSILLVMFAFIITFFEEHPTGSSPKGARAKLLYVLLFIVAGIGNVIAKAFTLSGSRASNEAFLTWVNIFMAIMMVIAFLFAQLKSKKSLKDFTLGIHAKNYLPVCLGSISGCIASVCSMKAISQMNIALYSPLSSAMQMVLLLFISGVILKEKVTMWNICAAILGIIAVVCTVL